MRIIGIDARQLPVDPAPVAFCQADPQPARLLWQSQDLKLSKLFLGAEFHVEALGLLQRTLDGGMQ